MEPQRDRQVSTLVVSEYEENEAVNAFELGYFLYYFRSAYVACINLIDGKDVSLESLSQVNREDLKSIVGHDVPKLWLESLPPELDLEFIAISKESPLKFVSTAAGGCLIALTMAVIISGGKANVYTGDFELPPLAEGIRELKDAFGQAAPRELPSERKKKHKSSEDFPRFRG